MKSDIKSKKNIFSKCGEMSHKCYQNGDKVLYKGNIVIIKDFDEFKKTYTIIDKNYKETKDVNNSEIKYFGDNLKPNLLQVLGDVISTIGNANNN